MSSKNEALVKINKILKINHQTLWTYIVLAIVHFLSGIFCTSLALITGKSAWAVLSLVATGFLYYLSREIEDIKRKDSLLAGSRCRIPQLFPDMADEHTKRVFKLLYDAG